MLNENTGSWENNNWAEVLGRRQREDKHVGHTDFPYVAQHKTLKKHKDQSSVLHRIYYTTNLSSQESSLSPNSNLVNLK